MNTQTHIKCACGQRITGRDVLTTGYLLQTGTQVFVFVKFRCPRCKKLGQEVINRERWDWAVLNEAPGELSMDERKKFEQMGSIRRDEAVEFHIQIAHTERIVSGE